MIIVYESKTGFTKKYADMIAAKTVIARNKIEGIPFFYLRGGCYPLKELKGLDKIMMKMFVKVLKKQEDKDEKQVEAISIIENGFDGVKEDNLEAVLKWINER